MEKDHEARRARWKWAIGILILAAIALAVIWSIDNSRQEHVLQSMITGLVTLTFLFVWAIFFSRLAGRVWLGSSVEISGVTGDLVPILRWKRGKFHAPQEQTNAVVVRRPAADSGIY